MTPLQLYRIALIILCCAVLWLYFNPRKEVVYERDEKVLKENKRLTEEIKAIQLERDSLRSARSKVKEMIVYRYKKLQEDEKIIPTLDERQLDSVIRTGF